MKPLPGEDRPWTLKGVHMALALAVGAGLPLAWAWWSAPQGQPAGAGPAEAAAASSLGPASVPAAHGMALAVAPTGEAAEPPVARAAAEPRPAARAAMPLIPRQRDPNGDLSPDITDFINQGEVPTMAEVISRLRAAGVQGGLAAFNPPGTRPPLVGIAVSADVELPTGYVRHHQFTDDGQPIEPILMFAPDHPLVAAARQAAEAQAQAAGVQAAALQPQDLVVPVALVPAGLPIRQIVVPPPADAGTPGKSRP